MYASIYRRLKSLKSGSDAETNGRHLIVPLAKELLEGVRAPEVLDVGAGYGADLSAICEACAGARAHAVEGFPLAVEALRARGIRVSSLDLERDVYPYPSRYFDLILCNQVLEHTKEIFWVISEIARLLKVGGKLILGVPNLGSLHNRAALALGKQPPAIHVFGPHVRGFTIAGLTDLVERGGVLKVRAVRGGNFYPFPPRLSRPLTKVLPGLAVSSFFVIEKLPSRADFLDIFRTPEASELVDTPFFTGADFPRADAGGLLTDVSAGARHLAGEARARDGAAPGAAK